MYYYKFSGLSGDENILDIGDLTSFIPVIKRDKLYNIKGLKQVTDSEPLFVIGPSGGPFPFIGVDSEASVYTIINPRCSKVCHHNSLNLFYPI